MFLSRTRALSAFIASAVAVTGVSAQSTDQPDLTRQRTLYAVGYAHLDTEWRWEYPQVIDEYLRKTMEDNFRLLDKYPHYVFNFSGANRYRMMKEYFPEDFARMKQYIAQGRWFPAGSSMEEGDVNAPNAEALIRQVLYGNRWFRREFGVASEEYMLPDCFGFPSSLPSILAHAGVKGFSTQKLTWGSSADAGGPDSLERTPEGTPFNVGVWVGPDGATVLSALNPGAYSGSITTDLSAPLPALPPNQAMADVEKRLAAVQASLQATPKGSAPDQAAFGTYFALRSEQAALAHQQDEQELQRLQGDWAARVENDGKVTGLYADYHYYGTGDIGGAPREESVKRLEAIITKGQVDLPPENNFYFNGGQHPAWPEVPVGNGPVHVISAKADQMFKDITPAEAAALPRYTGELELTNHSAGSLTSQAYQKRWIRKEELLADAAEKSSIAAQWLGARPYPQQRLNDAWTLAMAAHFHDLAAGTATPRSYEFAWNDDVIAMNQFAGVLKSAMDGVSAALDTEVKGTPLVVFNQLNIPREDLVEASLPGANGKAMQSVHVTAPDGTDVPAQVSNGKVVFAARVPSVGYAVYDVTPGGGAASAGSSSGLRISEGELENEYYRVRLNADGDVASIFDKKTNREMLAAPSRLALSYDNPQQWPAWNMDWAQEQAAPKEFVSGPARVRVVENGPVRVAIEVTRETDGSRFVQTIRLAAGEAGKRVEFSNVVDWATRERNLKATFPLTASNENATYNWDIGTIERPTAQPKKFEVPSHQWIDVTDASGNFGATILTDAKNGSDKPDDHTIRLTLIRTPGVAGGYPDQATQDLGHHEFVYGFAGHADGWRQAQTDWQGQQLNAPLLAFEAPKHGGALGKSFSLLKVSDPRVRVLGLKKAEDGDDVIVRLVELDGQPRHDVHVSFAAPVTSAREVNGQEQQLGEATVTGGELVTSFGAYQPRAFAVKLGASPTSVAAVQSAPVALPYDAATATAHEAHLPAGMDGKGSAYPSEMLPGELRFEGVSFHLAQGAGPNAVTAKGQRIALPSGTYNRVYLLAAANHGDQKAAFEVGDSHAELNIQNWEGFVGQWDDRVWSSSNTANDNYGEMVGLKPGFIKRADIAWYSDHYHDASGKNVPYHYSYLFAYALDLPAGAKTLRLPNNPNVRVLAVSVANEGTEVKPVQPLYDVLPASGSGAPDFALFAPSSAKVSEGRSTTAQLFVFPRGAFDSPVKVNATYLPMVVTATFSPAITTGATTMTLNGSNGAVAGHNVITVTGASGSLTHSATIPFEVTPILHGTIPVNISSAFNLTGIRKKDEKFDAEASLDGEGAAFPALPLAQDPVGDGVIFHLGPADAPDAVTSKTVDLPPGRYASLRVLATAVEGNQTRQTFSLNYTDGTSTAVTQSLSDWAGAPHFHGESEGATVPYRVMGDGSVDGNPFHLSAYTFALDPTKEVKSITLPSNRNVIVFAMTLVPASK